MSDCRYTVAVRCRPVGPTDKATLFSYQENTMNVKEVSFKFDHIFPNSSNEEVYEATVAPKIDDLFKGINVTVLAYGATGSGKTFTMGTEYDASRGDTEAGIIHRSVQDIFKKISTELDPQSYSVRASFIEIYREEVWDLLTPTSKIMNKIREYSDGFKVPNLLEVPAESAEDVVAALKRGCLARKTAPTAKNTKSSRSHGIFTVLIEQKEEDTLIKRAKFILVDLAGSERIEASKTEGKAVHEGIGINLGLMTLRQVVKSLAEKQLHAPYRNSNLTKILQDALEGTSQTVMIACVFPIDDNAEETISTLRYASLANTIIIKPKPCAVSSAAQIASLKKQVSELQAALRMRRFSGELPYEETTNPGSSTALRMRRFSGEPRSEETRNPGTSKNVEAALRRRRFSGEPRCEETRNPATLKSVDLKSTELHKDEGTPIKENPTPLNTSVEDKQDPLNDSNDCIILNNKLNEIAEKMSSNDDVVKNLEDLASSVEGIDQDIIQQLNKEIEKLTEEKDRLQGMVTTVIDEKATSDRERIVRLVKEISKLKADLKQKTSILEQKEASKKEIMRLKKESDDLKHLKVDLQKKIREAGTTYKRLNLEKTKEMSKLMKNSRKIEAEKVRMVSKLENEIAVMQRKLNLISQKKATQTSQKPTSNVALEARIKDFMDDLVDIKSTELINRMAAEEVESTVEQYEENAASGNYDSQDPKFQEAVNTVKFYCDTIKNKASEMKNQKSKIDNAIKNLINSLSSATEAKQGISLILNEFMLVYERSYLGNYYVTRSLKKKETQLVEDLENELKTNHKVTNEKKRFEEINNNLIQQVKDLSVQLENVKNLEGEAQIIEKLNMQESLIAELRNVIESYKEKDTEIQSLSKNLFQAKTGKTTPWLGSVPLRIPSQEETPTLVDEFLDETLEESLQDDPEGDPDWRATPLHKRHKEKLVRKLDDSDDDSPPKKVAYKGCSCSGGCKTNRCGCRKSTTTCNTECACKGTCANRAGALVS